MAIAESTHWYDHTGAPMYEVPYADPSKGMRNTTLRDAKKLSLVPSVTAILNIPAKPGLDRWKQNQILDAAWACPVEDEKGYKLAVVEMAGMKAEEARNKGVAIHADIERSYLGKPPLLPDYEAHVTNVNNALQAYGDACFFPEDSFASPLGYGGKVDLYLVDERQNGIVFDIKTKDFTEDADPKKLAYPENAMQLDAYRHGLNMPKAKMVNVFVDRETGIVKLYEWPEGNYFEMFTCLLKYWQLSKSYDSSYMVHT